jgi:predicted Zn-ribbon and HTH transcriptional regulator
MAISADDKRPRLVLAEPQRCPTCRTKIVVSDAAGILVKNAILRVSVDTGHASAKCPRCKSWVEVPLQYRK